MLQKRQREKTEKFPSPRLRELSHPLVMLNHEQKKVVIGLGNPGLTYSLTRHNVGFQVIDLYRTRVGTTNKAIVVAGSLVYQHRNILLVKPLSYMNESGTAVREVIAWSRRFEITLADCLIIYDDLDLQLSRMKILPQGGASGHRGMMSVIRALGTEKIPRLRIGIRPEEDRPQNLSDFVLERFTLKEWQIIFPVLERAADAIDLFGKSDINTVMNRFNLP
ncbi:aminoacyl-tRNA hydrolase [Candidatus Acetothermia bacterium]|nr:aminoacyl-tRNA hydrolase [Candidatus Acetothermia bacterium]MCI2427043.1 aminoacyl-tRNA hydrolase [Candidatus Acetothermia bacterium]MCI2428171.1 aminoacyl-tRNA hydrolase [Candidatus Acetothermia bacterium]